MDIRDFKSQARERREPETTKKDTFIDSLKYENIDISNKVALLREGQQTIFKLIHKNKDIVLEVPLRILTIHEQTVALEFAQQILDHLPVYSFVKKSTPTYMALLQYEESKVKLMMATTPYRNFASSDFHFQSYIAKAGLTYADICNMTPNIREDLLKEYETLQENVDLDLFTLGKRDVQELLDHLKKPTLANLRKYTWKDLLEITYTALIYSKLHTENTTPKDKEPTEY